MATGTSLPFTVGISNTPTFSMPSVEDERATYTLYGWTWNEATANPVYNSAARPSNPTYIISNPDIHGDTECDDVWAYLQAYLRRSSGRDGYLQRATAWRDYYVNGFNPGAPEYVTDASFLYDHFYGWGLQQYGTQFNDAAAKAKALTICTTLRDWWAAGGRSQSGNWPVAGVFDIAHYGHRGPSRNLHTAAAIADATGDAKAIELRDRLIDLWLQSPDWDNVHGMYWVSEEQMGGYDMLGPPPLLSYAAGDRAVSSFHIGQLAEAFFTSWLSPTVTAQRKTGLRSKIVAMATYMLHNGLDPTYRYCSSVLGIRGGSGAPWWNYSLIQNPVIAWDGVYTTSIVNLLVMGYKFTGDRNFLDATPGNNFSPAKYCFERGTKSIFNEVTKREAPDGVVGHFVDTQFDSSTEDIYLAHNKSELQYTYLIFENGGSPTVFA